MIVYNKTLLENTFLVAEAIDLKKTGFIDESNLNSIKRDLITLKTNRNPFVRIGFFLLGSFLFSSIVGFVLLIIGSAIENFSLIGFVYALIGTVLLEVISNQNYFRYGLDDAFIIGTQISLFVAIFGLTNSIMAVYVAMMLVGLIFSIRYLSTFSYLFFISGIVLLTSVFLIDHTAISALLPFILFIMAIGFYFIYEKIKNREQLYFYDSILKWHFVFTLFLGYLAINYFVVRTLSEELLDANYSKSAMPFGWIFTVLMFVIPVIYVYYSLQIRNRVMLYIGAITFVMSIATFRYYHSIMPAEWALIIAGTLIFGVVYFIIQKIKHKKTGITFEPDFTSNTVMLTTVEALIVNSQNIHQSTAPQQSDMPFGGGGFSGGGAGESF